MGEPGMVKCMKCQKPFKSPDKTRIRRCVKCKKAEDPFIAKTYRLSDINAAKDSR